MPEDQYPIGELGARGVRRSSSRAGTAVGSCRLRYRHLAARRDYWDMRPPSGRGADHAAGTAQSTGMACVTPATTSVGPPARSCRSTVIPMPWWRPGLRSDNGPAVGADGRPLESEQDRPVEAIRNALRAAGCVELGERDGGFVVESPDTADDPFLSVEPAIRVSTVMPRRVQPELDEDHTQSQTGAKSRRARDARRYQ